MGEKTRAPEKTLDFFPKSKIPMIKKQKKSKKDQKSVSYVLQIFNVPLKQISYQFAVDQYQHAVSIHHLQYNSHYVTHQ